MSRVAKAPVFIPKGVEININGQNIDIKGIEGKISYVVHNKVLVKKTDSTLTISLKNDLSKEGKAQAGTTRSLLNSMVIGVSKGFTKKLSLVGVGYRSSVKDRIIILSLGYSNPINYELPNGVTANCPSQNEIILKSCDKQLIGQVAADLRRYRRPEPYKGRGIRYAGEIIRIKEAKKK